MDPPADTAGHCCGAARRSEAPIRPPVPRKNNRSRTRGICVSSGVTSFIQVTCFCDHLRALLLGDPVCCPGNMHVETVGGYPVS